MSVTRRIRARFVWVVRVYNRMQREGGTLLSASLAYYGLFALAPLAVLAAAVLQFVLPSVQTGAITHSLAELFGPELSQSIAMVLTSMVQSRYSGLTSAIAVAVALWASVIGFMHLQGAVNAVWGLRVKPDAKPRQVAKTRSLQMLLVLTPFGIATVVALTSSVLAWVARRVELGIGSYAFDLLGSPITITLAAWVFTTLVYSLLPDATVRMREVWLPALVFAAAWTLGTHLMGLYLSNAGTSSISGAVGSLVVLLIWLNYSARALLFGEAICRARAENNGGVRTLPHAQQMVDESIRFAIDSTSSRE